MPIHHIILDGPVGPGEVINLQTVRDRYNQRPEGTDQIDVHIKTPGGSTHEAFSIYDFLNSVPEKVKTIAEGIAASAGTILFAAGDGPENRDVLDNAELMFHPPTLQILDNLNAVELKEKADNLEAHTQRIRQFFIDKFSLSDDKVGELMEGDNFLNADQAQELGIAKKVEKLEAVASINKPKIVTMDNQTSLFDQFKNIFKNNAPEQWKGALVNLKEGGQVCIESESGEIAAGARVQGVENEQPTGNALEDGDYTLESGDTITVKDGAVTEVKQKEEEASQVEDRLANIEASILALAQAVDKQGQALTQQVQEVQTQAETATQAVKMVTTKGKPFPTQFDYQNLPQNNMSHIEVALQKIRDRNEQIN